MNIDFSGVFFGLFFVVVGVAMIMLGLSKYVSQSFCFSPAMV